MISVGKCYLFINGSIKPANKKYTAIKNDYQVNIAKEGEVRDTEDDDNIKNPNEVYSFSTIKDIKSFTNDMRLDFIGVIVSIGDPDEINLKSGR